MDADSPQDRVGRHQPKHVARELAEVEGLDVTLALLEQCPHPSDDLRGADIVGGDVVHDVPQQLETQRLRRQQPLAGLHVGEDGRERLIQLVGQARRQLSEGGTPGGMGGFRAMGFGLQLGALASGGVGQHHDRSALGHTEGLDHQLIPAPPVSRRRTVLRSEALDPVAGEDRLDTAPHVGGRGIMLPRRPAGVEVVVADVRRAASDDRRGSMPRLVATNDPAGAVEHCHPRR